MNDELDITLPVFDNLKTVIKMLKALEERITALEWREAEG